MSGEWSPTGPTPIRPGFYITYQTVGSAAQTGGLFGTVGMPIWADWGPINTFTTITSVDELDAAFGSDIGTTTTTTHLVREALLGGANAVKVLRIAVAGAPLAKATVTLSDDTGGTPKTVILTAKYDGIRANAFRVTVQENPADPAYNDLIILEGNVRKEVYTHVKNACDALVADINSKSSLVTATRTLTGNFTTDLNYVTAVAMTGGNNGSTLTGTQYNDALDAFEREGGFDVFALDGVSDNTIITSTIAWADLLNENGNYVFTVVGGPENETVSAAITRSVYENEFVGSLYGDVLVTLRNGAVDARGSALLAPRVAGMVAAAGILGSITRGVMPGVVVETPLTKLEAESLISNGIISLYKRGSETVVEDGITSFTAFTDDKDKTFATISNVRVMQQMGNDLNRIFETEFLGKVRNTEAARQAVRTRVQGYLKTLEALGVLVNGSVVELDTRYTNTGHNIYLTVSIQFALELKRILVGIRTPAFTS